MFPVIREAGLVASGFLECPLLPGELELMAKKRGAGKLPIPCRHCGKTIQVPVPEGAQRLMCPACGRGTRVVATYEIGELKIRTSPE
jgi:hypothetical protein